MIAAAECRLSPTPSTPSPAASAGGSGTASYAEGAGSRSTGTAPAAETGARASYALKALAFTRSYQGLAVSTADRPGVVRPRCVPWSVGGGFGVFEFVV